MAESYHSLSLYNYVLNNPISNTDPDGTSVSENPSNLQPKHGMLIQGVKLY